MLQKKKKLSRKEIKQDKLIDFFHNAEMYFEKYKNKIFTYAAVLVVVAAAVYFYLNQKSENNEKAGLELSRIMSFYDQGAYLEAIEGKQGSNIIGLKKIVEEYDGTENGETAKIYLANCYSYLGNYDEAIKYYEDYSGSIDYWQAGLGIMLHSKTIKGQLIYILRPQRCRKLILKILITCLMQGYFI